MLTYGFVAAVLVATTYAAYCDWKTTEVSDFVSLVIGGVALLYYLGQSITTPLQGADLYFAAGTAAFVACVGMYLRIHMLYTECSQEEFCDRFVDHTAAPVDRYPRLERVYRGMARFWYGVGAAYAALFQGLERLVTPFSSERRPDVLATGLLLVSAALFYLGMSVGGVQLIILSVAAGTGLFAMGWAMYLAGMWGGADAFVLGALGYAFPVLPVTVVGGLEPAFPVPFLLVMTVFFVGAVYSLIYAFSVAFQNQAVMERFRTDVREYRTQIVTVTSACIATVSIGAVISHSWMGVPLAVAVQGAAVLLITLFVLTVVYRFLHVIETDVMRQTIRAEDLVEGDVLAQELDRVDIDAKRIVGVTTEQIEMIQEEYEEVDVRSGVQFIVAYPFAVILLLVFGDPLLYVMQILM